MAALPALRAEAGLAAFTVRLDASPLPAGVAAALREDGVVVLVLEDDGYLVDFYARAEASYHAFFARPEGDKERDAARSPAASYYAADRREWVHAASHDVAAVPTVGEATAIMFKVCRALALRVLRCSAPELEVVKRRDVSVLDCFSYHGLDASEPASMGDHTDPGLFTVATATHPGLEVAKRGDPDAFLPAHARGFGECAFVVFPGDALEARTSGAYAAARHRVGPHRDAHAPRLAFIFELRRDDEDRDFME